MSYKADLVFNILGKRGILNDPEAIIDSINIDSRRITHWKSTLFFAIKGPKHDGHHYISDLIEAGVKNFVVEDISAHLPTQNLNFILVDETVEGLQKLAAYHRSKFNYPLIGITGSNGKTTIKEWLYQLLHDNFKIIRNPRSYNSQVGVPLSIWQMSNDFDLGIFEAGISKPGEMIKLQKILLPEIGLFTNIGDAHSENFNSNSEKISEKMKLFEATPVLITRKGNSESDTFFHSWLESKKVRKLLTWSNSDPECDLYISSFQPDSSEDVSAEYHGKKFSYPLPARDEASYENSAFTVLTALYLGLSTDEIHRRMTGIEPVEMRLQKIEGNYNSVIINDTYNSDINSFEISVDYLIRQQSNLSNTVILTDILQTEKSPEELYKKVNRILEDKKIDRFIGIGKILEQQIDSVKIQNKEVYPDKKAFIDHLKPYTFANQNILIKGARKFGLEDIVKILERQNHQTVFEINLTAIERNYRYFRELLPSGIKIMGMVKAFSYGTGSFEIAKLLQDAGIDYLAVAYGDEGVLLRKKGITTPIMVMNPDFKGFDVMLEYDLEPEIYSTSLLKEFQKFVEKSGKLKHGVHIEIDTGMHRLGFQPEDIPELIENLNKSPNLKVKSVFSHLAVSDEAEQHEFTLKQIETLRKIESTFGQDAQDKPLFHILNSAGVLHYPEGFLDMVRLGIGLHGIDPSDKDRIKLEIAGSLKSYISQIKVIKAGEGIGYGLHAMQDQPRRIAIIAIGYADGFNRKLGNGKWEVLINGKQASTVGNICMDMFMADVSEISCNEGDDVQIFGKENNIERMAEILETIPYEILTSISQRVKRIYLTE
ncbi:MAG: bifunctional UDP-N-acetylmuramoyl-tripeptide:D-alanyl-D-alanine ligase/alanine racemase [Flavobacteriales bacterium]|nr:bifunctional UDP-N-acetylmuramoyl-tripeptide:D-alanyl-D-alanine ligase/alanine racemase [Flavobacteriales bacterium]